MMLAVMRAPRVWVGGLLAVASCYTGLPEPGADPWVDDDGSALADTGGDDDGAGGDDLDDGDAGDAGDDDGDGGDGIVDGGDGGDSDGGDVSETDGGGDGGETDGAGEESDGDGTDGTGAGVGEGSDGADAGDTGGAADDGPAPGTDDGAPSDDGDTSDDGMPGVPDDDLPNNAYCNTVAGWSESWSDLEAQVLTLVNQKRAQVIDCGGGNVLGPAPPVAYDPALTCAARNHSKDMADNGFFSHTNLQGQGPSQRLALAGYAWSTWGENIAAGYGTAQQVVDGWIASQGHCVNLMNPAFTELGTGYYHLPGSEYGHYWTQNFGTPN